MYFSVRLGAKAEMRSHTIYKNHEPGICDHPGSRGYKKYGDFFDAT